MIPQHSPAVVNNVSDVLEAVELTCVRGERLLFEGLSFQVASGSTVLVEGSNGSGKTTLLRTVCGLMHAEEGEVRWNGAPIDRDRLAFQGLLGYLGHIHGIKDELTAAENLRFAAALQGTPPAGVAAALARVGLGALGEVRARQLSAGQRRRLALARLLLGRARLWVLDEPFTALDRAGIALVEEMIEGHCAAGGMVLMSSHHGVTLNCIGPLRVQL